MKISQLAVFILAIACLLSGCLKGMQEYTINPNGSGKVHYKIIKPLDGLSGFGARQKGNQNISPEEKAKKAASKILEQAKGVHIWKDVSYSVINGEKLKFEGIAYFESLSRLKIGDGKKSSGINFEKGKDGSMFLEIKDPKNKKETKPPQPIELSEEALKEKVEEAKAKLNQSIQFLSMFMKDLEQEMVFHLPGKIASSTNLEKVNENTVKFVLDGPKYINAMKQFAGDEAWLKKQILAGKKIGKEAPSSSDLIEKLFGEKGPIKANIAGQSKELKNLFDFEKEIKEAKKHHKEMMQKLGFDSTEKDTTSKKEE